VARARIVRVIRNIERNEYVLAIVLLFAHGVMLPALHSIFAMTLHKKVLSNSWCRTNSNTQEEIRSSITASSHALFQYKTRSISSSSYIALDYHLRHKARVYTCKSTSQSQIQPYILPPHSLNAPIRPPTHGKLAALHLQLVLLEFSGLLLLVGEEGSVLLAAGATLLDAAESHDAEEEHEEAEGAGDDADFGALGESGPAVADAGGFLDFVEDGGGVFCAATDESCVSMHIYSGW